MSITAATAIYQLVIASVFPSPQQLQGYAADDAFATEPIESAEVQMGVDGFLSGGFVFKEVPQEITLQADSPSGFVFDQWWQQQQVNQEVLDANAVIVLRSLGQKWNLTKGFLTLYTPIPAAKKILQPRKFRITWERISTAVT